MVLYNVTGRAVERLVDGFKEAGLYQARLDADELSSGVCFYRIVADEFDETQRMTLMKQVDAVSTLAPAERCEPLVATQSNGSELLTKATYLPSGDHDGTLIVPCPPYTYAITSGRTPSGGFTGTLRR